MQTKDKDGLKPSYIILIHFCVSWVFKLTWGAQARVDTENSKCGFSRSASIHVGSLTLPGLHPPVNIYLSGSSFRPLCGLCGSVAKAVQ